MADADLDTRMRMAAFEHVRTLSRLRQELTAAELKGGFPFEGNRVPLLNPQMGIFKPQAMRYLLSIRTVYPKAGARVWYDDQRHVLRQIDEGAEEVDYAFMGNNPDAAPNRWLRDACESRVPIIYFVGFAPGLYQAFLPSFISGWTGVDRRARVVFGRQDLEFGSALTAMQFTESSIERQYSMGQVRQRLHQSNFRAAVLKAYDGRCAITGLPEPMLLDAAHIIPDRDEKLGQPVISNGLPLSKLHHAAFDGNLIGIDQDRRVHVAKRLQELHDGPTLKAIQEMHGRTLSPPRRPCDAPDPNRLKLRFEQFRDAI